MTRCPRCGGQMFREYDNLDPRMVCLQCGHSPLNVIPLPLVEGYHRPTVVKIREPRLRTKAKKVLPPPPTRYPCGHPRTMENTRLDRKRANARCKTCANGKWRTWADVSGERNYKNPRYIAGEQLGRDYLESR